MLRPNQRPFRRVFSPEHRRRYVRSCRIDWQQQQRQPPSQYNNSQGTTQQPPVEEICIRYGLQINQQTSTVAFAAKRENCLHTVVVSVVVVCRWIEFALSPFCYSSTPPPPPLPLSMMMMMMATVYPFPPPTHLHRLYRRQMDIKYVFRCESNIVGKNVSPLCPLCFPLLDSDLLLLLLFLLFSHGYGRMSCICFIVRFFIYYWTRSAT